MSLVKQKLESLIDKGKSLFIRMDLTGAEKAYRNVLHEIKNSYQDCDDLKVDALVGLAEVESKRCRQFRETEELPWFRGMVRSLALYKEAMNLTEKQISEENKSDPVGNAFGKSRRFSSCSVSSGLHYDVQSQIASHTRQVEETAMNLLRDKILSNCSHSSDAGFSFDDAWLKKMTMFCRAPQVTDEIPGEEAENPDEYTFTSETVEIHKCTASVVPIYKRKINFDHIQDAIMKLVSEVSTDVRSQYQHMTRLAPQKLIQNRLTSEITLRLAPGSKENQDLLDVLEDAIKYEDLSESTLTFEVDSNTETCDFYTIGFQSEPPQSIHNDESISAAPAIENISSRSSTCSSENENESETIFLKLDASAFQETQKFEKEAKYFDRYSTDCKYNRMNGEYILHNAVHSDCAGLSKSISDNAEHTLKQQDSDEDSPSKVVHLRNILTLWRSQLDDLPIVSNTPYKLQSMEEISPLTERDKVLNWLEKVEESTLNASETIDDVTLNRASFPDMIDISHTIAELAMKSAKLLQYESKFHEAIEVYKFALGIFQLNPIQDGFRQNEVVAELLKNIGLVKCSLGHIAVGSQLMEESVKLYGGMESKEGTVVSTTWFQLGDAFLLEDLRHESILSRSMQLIQEEFNDEFHTMLEGHADQRDNGSDVSSDSCDEDGYCICIHEAMECYKQAIAVLTEMKKEGLATNADVHIGVLCNLADCYFMTGSLDLAEVCYEEALLMFPNAHGIPMLARNSHVLSMLGTLNFLLGNYVRAATMYETSHILRQHYDSGGLSDDSSLEAAWTLTMLGFSCYLMKHYDASVGWCSRAFTLYTRVLRGTIFETDFYNRWFIIETLYRLGHAYVLMNSHENALYYLNLCKNMTVTPTEVDSEQDTRQLIRVLRALADAYTAKGNRVRALQYYEEAVQYTKLLGGEHQSTALQNQLLNSMAGVNVDSQNYKDAGSNLERALDFQKDVQSSIKTDMVAMLQTLGKTSVLACDVDKAIGCYSDCVQAYREMNPPPIGEEVVSTLATLANLYHVKGCMQDDDETMEYLLAKSKNCFQEALSMVGQDGEWGICVQYANYLYQQGLYADGLQVMLPFVFCDRSETIRLVYTGVEQAVLPDHIQRDFGDDTMTIEARMLAKFLAVLCFRNLGLSDDTDDVLVELLHAANRSRKAGDYELLAFALLETHLYPEAAESFLTATYLNPARHRKTAFKFWITLFLAAYTNLARCVDFLFDHIFRNWRESKRLLSFEEQKRLLHVKSSSTKTSLMSLTSMQSKTGSGEEIYNNANGKNEIWEEWSTEEVFMESPTPPSLNGLTTPSQADYTLRSVCNPRLNQNELNPLLREDNKYDLSAVMNDRTLPYTFQPRDSFIQSRDPIIQSHDPIIQSRDPIIQSRDPIIQSRFTNSQARNALPIRNNGLYPDSKIIFEMKSSRVDNKNIYNNCRDTLNGNSKEINGNCVNGDVSSNDGYEEWVTFEEVVDTPAAILRTLMNNNRLRTNAYH